MNKTITVNEHILIDKFIDKAIICAKENEVRTSALYLYAAWTVLNKVNPEYDLEVVINIFKDECSNIKDYERIISKTIELVLETNED